MRIGLLIAGLCIASVGFADTLTLRSGRVVNGTYLGGNSRQIRMAVGDGIESFDVTQVATIQFSGASTSSSTSTSGSNMASGTTAAPSTPPTSSSVLAPSNPPASESNVLRPSDTSSATTQKSGVVLPAGTVFTVRMIDSVDSDQNRVGQTFAASMDEPVMIDGETVIPRGSDVVVKLVDTKESGKLTGRSELTLDLVSVKVDGRMVDINTQGVTQQSSSRGSRTAKMATGGAALGAIIGAIAGGGKGAAIGAATGAGAGAGVEVLTKGQRVHIPSETRLTFTLENPVRL